MSKVLNEVAREVLERELERADRNRDWLRTKAQLERNAVSTRMRDLEAELRLAETKVRMLREALGLEPEPPS